MKKVFVLISMALAVYSCSSSDDECGPVTPDGNNPVEIKLNAGVLDVNARAPIASGNPVSAVFVASGTTNDYSTYLWSDTVSFNANSTPSAALSFTPKQYYPSNSSSVYIKAFYPASSVATTNNIVKYSATDGSVDVLMTGEQSGTRLTASPLNFVFNHLLTQLQFKFVTGTMFPTGKTVTNLVIKNAQTFPTQLDLNTGTLTYSTTPITFSGKSYSIGNSSGSAIADTPMVLAGSPVILSITTSDGVTYPDLTLSSLTTAVGQSHLITITFNLVEITATVSVTNWVTGTGTGSTVQ